MTYERTNNKVRQLLARWTKKVFYSLLGVSCFLLSPAPSQQLKADDMPAVWNEPEVRSYLQDLEELGYCVIPRIFSSEETRVLYERVWHEYVEKAWPRCKMEDRSNWKEEFPIHNKMGIFAGPAGQIQVMWDIRQDTRIIDAFAKIWNTSDLIVSMDGISLMCPTEIREGYFEPWPHVDQSVLQRLDGVKHSNNPPDGFVSESSLSTQPFTIQGQFLFEDSCERDGGFYCIPKSHLKFHEFAPKMETLMAMDISREEKKAQRQKILEEYFATESEEGVTSYAMKHVTAPRGSIILWDSRTIHWNQHADKDRPYEDLPRVRMVGYVCYVPKARLSDDGRVLRKAAFENGVSTGHNPAYPELKYSKDHIQPQFIEYLEDPAYVQPSISLTPVGESLLGF